MISEDINTFLDFSQLKTVNIWDIIRRETQRSVKSEVIFEGYEVAESPFLETAQVGRVIGIGVTIVLAENTGEHAHLVEQVDRAKRGGDVGADEDDGQMTRQVGEEVATHVFLTRCNKQNEYAVSPRTSRTADEVGEREKTPVALVAEVGDDA
jgi:hypothetical protein